MYLSRFVHTSPLAGIPPDMPSFRRALAASLLLIAAACHPDFQISSYPTSPALYRAGLQEFQQAHWDNAVTVFEKLTTDLPARDTLLPRSHWYLGRSHQERGEWVLAATSFAHLVESFPDDTLADDAALESARSYRKLWRKPALDPTYGENALASFTTLMGLYPQSPLIPQAKVELAELEDMFAQKNYLSGMYYFRRGGFDSAIIYFKDIVAKYPTSPTTKLARLRLVDSYKAIRYREDASDACLILRTTYPNDDDVAVTCKDVAVPGAPATTPSPAPPAATPATTRPPR